MELSITFRHLAPSDALKTRVEQLIQRWERHLGEPSEVSVVLHSLSRMEQRCDVRAIVDEEEIVADATFPDLSMAVDVAFSRAASRLRYQSGRRLPARRETRSSSPGAPGP